MDYICQVCDRSLNENPTEYQYYQVTSRKNNDEKLFIKYTINNITLDELYKILNDYTNTHNEKIDFYSISWWTCNRIC